MSNEIKALSRKTDETLAGLLRTTITPYPLAAERAAVDETIATLRAEVTKLRAVVEAAREYRDASEASCVSALQPWPGENRLLIAGRVSAARDALFATLDQAPPKGGE